MKFVHQSSRGMLRFQGIGGGEKGRKKASRARRKIRMSAFFLGKQVKQVFEAVKKVSILIFYWLKALHGTFTALIQYWCFALTL